MSTIDLNNTKSITLLDADGVFIKGWLDFQKYIGPVISRLSGQDVDTIEDVIKLLAQDFPDFINNVFDLKGLEYLHRILNDNHVAAVTTDRFEHFPFFNSLNWGETPALKDFIKKYLNKIEVFTDMKRSRGGNDNSFPGLVNHLRKQIINAYKDKDNDINKKLIIRLVSDVKSSKSNKCSKGYFK